MKIDEFKCSEWQGKTDRWEKRKKSDSNKEENETLEEKNHAYTVLMKRTQH